MAAVGWLLFKQFQALESAEEEGGGRRGGGGPAPVAVAHVETGAIDWRRRFSGTLEPTAEFIVAPKVGGRLLTLDVHPSDTVTRGQEVGTIDRTEFELAVAQANADVAVAEANLQEARNALTISERELSRAKTLVDRGVSSESQLDTVQAAHLAKQSAVDVAKGQLARAQAALQSARVHLGYTTIEANWSGGSDERIVSARYIDEGQTLSPNEPLLSIVELNPILGVIFITERDYARLSQGQRVELTTDAFPGESFEGRITRIAPVFNTDTRQARIELAIDNADLRLKPGMFIRATILLDHVEDATIVPAQALTTRGDTTGVFLVSDDGGSVTWQPVTIGIREDERVQILEPQLSGRVVTLGQQLIEDGSAITIPDVAPEAPAGEAAREQP